MYKPPGKPLSRCDLITEVTGSSDLVSAYAGGVPPAGSKYTIQLKLENCVPVE
jgi:hypothetical protein